MFDLLNDIAKGAYTVADRAVSNTVSIGIGLVYGELPTQSRVTQLMMDGLTIYEISNLTGFGVDVIRELSE